MPRYAAIALSALLAYFSSPSQDFVLGPTAMRIAKAIAAAPVVRVVNTITVTNESARAIRRYPLQFGRPFLKGAIGRGRCPVVALDGAALPTQADVKNRYPDGSAEFAVIAVVLPSLPANGAVRLSFAAGICDNTPLSTGQMLDPAYNFDATMRLVAPDKPARLVSANDSGVYTLAQWRAVTNGGFRISINGTPVNVSGINMSPLAANWSNFFSLIQAGLPRGLTVSSGSPAGGITVLSTTATGPRARLSYATRPTNGSQDIGAMLDLTRAAGARLTATGSAGAEVGASARTMLANGDYRLWTSGPVAQTIVLADDSASRKYDVGLGDGHRPFRPRFVATFWSQTHQVLVRAIGENGLTTELEDLGPYNLTIIGGHASPTIEKSLAGFTQGAMTTWTKEFWLGGAPPPQVDIDSNLAYLEATRFIPNYDPTLSPSRATIANDYAAWWTRTNHDIGGSGAWAPGMPTTGARADIGPEPSWDALWLYTGDWRMRQVALGNADLAGAWPVNLRETDPAMRLNRADPAPVAPAVGSGYGRPVSITDRVDLGPSAGGEGIFLYYNSGARNPPNKLDVVGPLNTNGAWAYDVAHEPSPFFVPYILTGDPFYLEELENWAAYDAAANQGLAAAGSSQGRGPTGAEGGLYYELRGDGWGLKSRAEAAFAVPDGDPEKAYLTILTQEDIARWEGALGVADPVLSGYAEYAWAQRTGDPESRNTPNHAPPPLHNWEDSHDPGFDGGGQWRATLTANGYTNQWMQWYVQYSIGRAAELGFAAGPLTLYSGQYLINEIDRSGYPMLVGAYLMPTNFAGSGPIASWPDMIADLSPSYLTGIGWSGKSSQAPLPNFFARQLYTQGYDVYVLAALAPLLDEGAPGAAQAEAWVRARIYRPLVANGALAGDPSWAIVPRTDHNTLPAQPTTPQ